MTDVENEMPGLRHRYAALIRQLRTEAGLTQQALGGAVGLHRTYINHLESGAVNVSLDNLEKLLAYLAPDGDSRSLRVRLAQNLKSYRGGRSQEALAAMLDLPVLFISRIERAAVSPSIDQVARLADKLAVTGESLLK